jgi:hypothetical protein
VDEQAEAGVAEDFGLAGVVGQADAVFGEKRDGVEKSNRPDPDLTFPVFELILYTAKEKIIQDPQKGKGEVFMKKAICLLAALSLGMAVLAGAAMAWERGTHAFIADKLKKAGGPYNIDEMYGAMAPDVFNYLFTMPNVAFRDYLYDQTHHQFLKVKEAVKWGYEKSSAYGFLSHNNVWGADSTAHIASRTLLLNEGYVITKAKMLHDYLMMDPGYAALVGPYPGIGIEICHNVIEAAGDIILARNDASVGAKLMEIALRPKPHMQNLMVRAYAQGLADSSNSLGYPITLAQAEQLIRSEETNFRMSCISYGYLLQQSESVILENVIEQFKELAKSYLALYLPAVPDDAIIVGLLETSFPLAIGLIQNDYMKEIQATIAMVKRNMVKEVK